MRSPLPAVICLLSIAATTHAQQQQRQSAQAVPVTFPTPIDLSSTFEALVDQLTVTERDLYQEMGQSFQTRESHERISWAFRALVDAGKNSWPVVMGHRNDRRRSTYTVAAIGPNVATVGEKCYYILRKQIVSLPRGYVSYKLSNERKIDQLFAPSLEQWLLARREQPLERIRIEVLEHLLSLERATQSGDPAYQPEAIPLLERHLMSLRDDLAEVERIAR